MGGRRDSKQISLKVFFMIFVLFSLTSLVWSAGVNKDNSSHGLLLPKAHCIHNDAFNSFALRLVLFLCLFVCLFWKM